MLVRFRPLPVWPHPVTDPREPIRFKASYDDTLRLLEREIAFLGGSNVIIAAGFAERDIRQDGYPRSDARQPVHPGVELSFDSKHGRLVYATDRYQGRWLGQMPDWQANLRAIALSLEALRAVDRHGVSTRGQQYAGWKELPSRAMGGLDPTAARAILRDFAGEIGETGDATDRALFVAAVKQAHPDVGGTAERFRAVQEAGRVLGVAS